MAAAEPEPSSDGKTTGLKRELSSFVKNASAHAKIRGELLAIEAKEAAGIYGRTLGLAIAGAVLLIVGYLLILAGLIGILALLLAGSSISLANWIGASWILAILHLILGFLFLKKSKKAGANTTAFEYTRAELKKDQQWLTNERKP